MKYELMAFFAGVCCKLGDDLNDNQLLLSFNTPFIIELLKGFHYILFTSVSLDDCLFFYLAYYVNYIHFMFNHEAFSGPYESSLFFTYSILFFIINQSQMFVDFNSYDFMCVLMAFLISGAEHFICSDEVSIQKLIFRTGLVVVILATLWVSWINSKALTYLSCHVIGYATVSSIVQFYSLFIAQPPLVTEEKPPLVTEEKPPLVTEEKPPLVTEEKPPLVTEEKPVNKFCGKSV